MGENNICSNVSIAAQAGSDEKVIEHWGKVDLKVLFAILTLADDPITQTKLAQRLKVSHVTLSRLVNSDDHRVREAWIPTLAECLVEIDLDRVWTTVNALRNINWHIKDQEFLMKMIPVLEKYISKRGFEYKADLEYWGLTDGIIRFYNAKDDSQWLISMGLSKDIESWRLVRTGLGPFSRYRRMQSIGENDRISILYNRIEWFSGSVKMSKYRQTYQHLNANSGSLPCYQSLLFCNPRSDQIEEEYVLLNDDECLE